MSSKNNLTPDLTVAGTWEPVDVQYLTASYIGNLADTLYSSLTLPDGRLGLAIGGWAWAPNATANVPTGIAILARQPDGTMALDLALPLARPAAFEYVLVHELCHLLQANHSPRFWREVEARFPDWRREREYLRGEGRTLKARLRGLLAG